MWPDRALNAAPASRRTLALALTSVLLVLPAGCGGDDTSPGQPPNAAKHRHREPPHQSRPAKRPKSQSELQPRAVQRSPSIPSKAKRARVVRVVDGDTVELAGLGNSRLIGVDTPEVYGGVECFGPEASGFAKTHLSPGRSVYFTRGVEATDHYGRPLIYVWLQGGTFFNASLVKKGYATPLAIEPNTKHAALFNRLATIAKRSDRGLWAASACGSNSQGNESSGRPSKGSKGSRDGCEAGYSPCVPRYPPDLDCADVDGPIKVTGRDPHGFDADNDGVGCES